MDLGLRSRWVRWRQEAALPTFYLPSMRSTTSFVGDPSPNYDRFIPNRSTTDFDLGRTLLTDSRKEKEKSTLVSPSKEAYRKHLAEALMQNRTRIFAFKNKPAEPVEDGFQECSSVLSKSVKRLRHIPQLRTLRGVHQSRVGSLAWNRNILTTGGMDGMIVNNDVRARSHIVQTYRGHKAEVCGLKWSSSGQKLASGGNDNLIHIWDLRMSSNPPRNQNQWLHRFGDHMAEVKALAWCPFQNNLLASGGGATDRCIKLWNAQTGARLNSVDTGSQVSGLHWNENERELLSSHGFTRNQLTLWKYPLMVKVVELTGHISQVLFTAQSPDGYTVASAAAGDDNSLRIWNAFGTPKVTNPATKAGNAGAFSSFNHIR